MRQCHFKIKMVLECNRVLCTSFCVFLCLGAIYDEPDKCVASYHQNKSASLSPERRSSNGAPSKPSGYKLIPCMHAFKNIL